MGASGRQRYGGLGLAWLLVAGCVAVPPAPVAPAETPASNAAVATVASPPANAPTSVLAESPPFDPVEPPPQANPAPASAPVAAVPESAPVPAPVAATPATASPAPPVVVVPPPVEPSDEQLMAAVVADLQRYTQLSADELRRELAAVTQALARQRNDAQRVRLAMLYAMARTAQDDQRALQLFDNVSRSGPGSPAIKQLATVLQVQLAERVRAVREEQQKADAAVQKLEALRAMERSLLRDRVRSGGGGGGGGGGSSGGN